MPDDDEQTLAWTACLDNSPVICADGTEIGRVLDVAALPEEDIFHGIVFHHHLLGRSYLAPAADVARITDRAVYLSADPATAEGYDEFHEMKVKHLGLRGIFGWKHLGWTKSPE